MNKYFIVLFFQLFFCVPTNGQSVKYEIENRDFFYIEFDIRSKSAQPIIMNGLTEFIEIEKISKKDINSFVSDFYKNTFYVPDIALEGYKELLIEFMGKAVANKYFKANPDIGIKTANKISENSLEKEIRLDSGEIIYLQITKVKGSFWIIYKDNKKLTTTSNELDINKIKNIEKCYVPFEIKCFLKPNKFEIN